MAKRKYEVLGLGPDFCAALQTPLHDPARKLLSRSVARVIRKGDRFPRRRSSTAHGTAHDEAILRSVPTQFAQLVTAINRDSETA